MSSNIHSASQEILKKAIQKATDGGWTQPWVVYHGNVKNTEEKFSLWLDNTLDDFLNSESHVYYDYDEFICVPALIFNHDFARALWGTEYTKGDKLTYQRPKWQVNLMRMVIADDPIKYLGENI